MKKCYELIKDPEFQSLFPSYSDKEYLERESYLTEKGCPFPLKHWNNILIMDYLDYDICKSWGIEFEIQEMMFESREDAIIYLCKYIINNKKISSQRKRFLIGKGSNAIRAMYTESPYGTTYNPFPFPIPAHLVRKHQGPTISLSAFIFKNSAATIYEYARFAAAIDRITSKTSIVLSDLLDGEKIPISVGKLVDCSRLDAANIESIVNMILSGKNVTLIKESIIAAQRESLLSQNTIQPSLKMPQKSPPEIKNLPKYDPDAEIQSLTYTIPSWISIMQRALKLTRFDEASGAAKNKLTQKLIDLTEIINTYHSTIKENEKHD